LFCDFFKFTIPLQESQNFPKNFFLIFQNSLLPPSQRCRNQTDKEPTGPYQRDKLLKYLEDKAKTEKDWEEVVPFSPGIKRGFFNFFG